MVHADVGEEVAALQAAAMRLQQHGDAMLARALVAASPANTPAHRTQQAYSARQSKQHQLPLHPPQQPPQQQQPQQGAVQPVNGGDAAVDNAEPAAAAAVTQRPLHVQGEVVWALVKGFPRWPAMVLTPEQLDAAEAPHKDQHKPIKGQRDFAAIHLTYKSILVLSIQRCLCIST